MAIGTGAMTTALVMSVVSLLLVLIPVAVAVALLAWFVLPDARHMIEEALPAGLAFAISALGAQIVLRAGMATCWFTAFVGPKNLVRDHLAASIGSRTAAFAASAAVLNLVLIVVMRFPFGDARSPIIILATAALLALDLATLRGVVRISRTSRSAAFFAGMSETEKKVADRPWPVRRRPSFADPSTVESIDDAWRYSRRATDAAELHTWIGAGIIVIFTAFIGSSISASWEEPGPLSMISVYAVFGFAALGFWIQRRARSYRSLANEFAVRARVLEARRDAVDRRLQKHQPSAAAEFMRLLRRPFRRRG